MAGIMRVTDKPINSNIPTDKIDNWNNLFEAGILLK
jgi:hypothetical protein